MAIGIYRDLTFNGKYMIFYKTQSICVPTYFIGTKYKFLVAKITLDSLL